MATKVDDSHGATTGPSGNPSKQHPRKFDETVSDDFYYTDRKQFDCYEGALGRNLLQPIHEFKLFNTEVEPEKKTSNSEWILKLVNTMLRFACACLNSRQNGTIHFGIADEIAANAQGYDARQVVGVEVPDEIFDDFELELRTVSGKMKEENFEDKDKDKKAAICIRDPIFIPVRDGSRLTSRYIIEYDIVPHHRFSKGILFKVNLEPLKKEKKYCAFERTNKGGNPSSARIKDEQDFRERIIPDLDGMREDLELGRSTPPLGQSKLDSGRSDFATQLKDESSRYIARCREMTKDLFVETTACCRAKEDIGMENTLVLVGNSGDGKTAILRHLSAKPLRGYHPVSKSNLKEIKKCINLVQGTDINVLFVIDEPFGGSYIQQKLVDDWVNQSNDLEMHLGIHKFIFATRKSVWSDCKVHFHENPFFSNTMEVTSGNLTDEDKSKLLKTYLKGSGKLTEEQKESIVCDNKPIAYGQCCKLMADGIQKGQAGAELVEIFRRPFSYISSELHKMADKEKEKYATLCLLMLCGGMMKCKDLAGSLSDLQDDIRERINVVLEACGYKNLTCGLLQQCAETLVGTYLDKIQYMAEDSNTWEVYTFSHDSIYAAVVMKYGKLHFGHCLKFLHRDIILGIVRPYKYLKGEQEFAIDVSTEYYAAVVEMFISSAIDKHSNLYEVFNNPIFEDEEFQTAFCKHLASSPAQLKAFVQRKSMFDEGVLYFVAQSGALKLLKFLMDGGLVQPGSFSSLCGAASRDRTEIVDYLVTLCKASQADICLAIESACSGGGINALRMLLPELCEQRNRTIRRGLRTACQEGHQELIEYILPLITPEQREKEIEESLRLASFENHPKAVEYLLSETEPAHLEHAVDVVLTEACAFGRQRVVACVLLKFLTPCRGQLCVCRKAMTMASLRGWTGIVRVLCSHGTDMDATDDNGNTCLHKAAVGGSRDTTCITYLVTQGARVSARNNYDVSPLHLAANRFRAGAVSVLLESEADVNMRDKWGQTPLHAVMIKDMTSTKPDRRDTVEKLLQHGVDDSITDKWDRTALDLANETSTNIIRELFVKHGYQVNVAKKRLGFYPQPADYMDMHKAGYW